MVITLKMPVKMDNRKDFFTGTAVLLMLCLLLGWSCRTTRKATVTTAAVPAHIDTGAAAVETPALEKLSAAALHDKVAANHISFRTFSARARIDFENQKQQQQGITAFVRVQRDSAVWISVRPVLGIELARILITPDSVKMINYFKKTVYLQQIDSLQALLHMPFDFNTLQDLIMGNPVYLSDTLQDITYAPSAISFTCEGPHFLNQYRVFAEDYLLQENHLVDNDTSLARTGDLQYGDYETVNGQKFATRRHIVFSARHTTVIDIKFNRQEFDQPLTFPFAISSKYQVE